MAKRKMRLDVTFEIDMPEDEISSLSKLPAQLNKYRDSIELLNVHSAYCLDAYADEPEWDGL